MVSKQIGPVEAAVDCVFSCLELVALQEQHSRSPREGWPTNATAARTSEHTQATGQTLSDSPALPNMLERCVGRCWRCLLELPGHVCCISWLRIFNDHQQLRLRLAVATRGPPAAAGCSQHKPAGLPCSPASPVMP